MNAQDAMKADSEREARLAELRKRLKARIPDENDVGCFLCNLILQDLEDGKLTGTMMDFQKQPVFPRSGELAHLKLEGIPFVEGDL